MRREDPPQLWMAPMNGFIAWIEWKEKGSVPILKSSSLPQRPSLLDVGAWVSSVFSFPIQTHACDPLWFWTGPASLISLVLQLPASWAEQSESSASPGCRWPWWTLPPLIPWNLPNKSPCIIIHRFDIESVLLENPNTVRMSMSCGNSLKMLTFQIVDCFWLWNQGGRSDGSEWRWAGTTHTEQSYRVIRFLDKITYKFVSFSQHIHIVFFTPETTIFGSKQPKHKRI